jgi:hypothetical protein
MFELIGIETILDGIRIILLTALMAFQKHPVLLLPIITAIAIRAFKRHLRR